MEFIKNYFKGRTVPFYVAFGIAAFSLLSAILYAALIGGSDYMSWIAFVLLLLAFPAFLVLSYFGYGKIGAGVVAGINLAAAVLLVADIFPYVWQVFSDLLATSGVFKGGVLFGGGVAVLALLLVSAIAANVVAWMNMGTAQTAESEEVETEADEEEIETENDEDEVKE